VKKVTILFDLDGTLIDSTEAILHCFYHTFDRFALPRPKEEEITKLIGHPLDFMYLHLGVKNPEPFVRAYKECYKEVSKKMTRLLPGAKEAVLEAYGFANLGVVTTKTGLYSKELLEFFGLLEYFKTVIGREDVINPKPHPEPVLKALHQIGALKEHSWMVGDTCLDIEAANAASIHSVALLCGYESKESLRRCAKYIKDDAPGAVRFIKHFENV